MGHNHVLRINCPTEIPMVSSYVKLKSYKVSFILKYHISNNHVHPKKYTHHILFVYIPFRDGNKLKFNKTYIDLETINLNHVKLKSYVTLGKMLLKGWQQIRWAVSIHLFRMKIMMSMID